MLPNRRSFVARYEKVSRRNLPRNKTTKKYNELDQNGHGLDELKKVENIVRKIARLGAKVGSKLGSSGLFRKGITAGTKELNSELGKILIDEGIKHVPDICKLGRSKIKNKNVEKALESDVANYLVEETQKKQKKY